MAALITVVVLVAASTAAPATPTQRTVTALQKQVRTLQRQVRTLQTQVRAVRETATAGIYLGFCVGALTADAFQSTWTVMNQVAGRSVVPSSPSVDDRGRCTSLHVSRQIGVVPPSFSPFSALFALLQGRSAAPS